MGFLKKVDIKKIRIFQMEINDDPGFCFQLTLVLFIRWFYIIGQCNICDLTLADPILLSEQDHFVRLKIGQCYSMAPLIILSTLSLIKCSGAAVWMYTQCSLHTPNQKQLSVVRCSGKIASLEI